ncbi:hypothetical protein [Desulfovibrio sp. JC022]|uniref:hypothetical protein n=1 Tax=Desulfovibrio sp. JC022 TaxID=2593642 RepID=UPI0013CF8900|nr:hypothetical protein [Desulfovibrio sp. JC022]NDV24603.1 hypothetical protein [Desulfovibrio sp. JC022]
MKKVLMLILCAMLLLGFAGCAKKFSHAQSAKTSMHDVGESAEDLKDETESSKHKTEDIKEKEAQDNLQGHQW